MAKDSQSNKEHPSDKEYQRQTMEALRNNTASRVIAALHSSRYELPRDRHGTLMDELSKIAWSQADSFIKEMKRRKENGE